VTCPLLGVNQKVAVRVDSGYLMSFDGDSAAGALVVHNLLITFSKPLVPEKIQSVERLCKRITRNP
jgi:hypothetical protein